MDERLTCGKCDKQIWNIYNRRIRCAVCGEWYDFDSFFWERSVAPAIIDIPAANKRIKEKKLT